MTGFEIEALNSLHQIGDFTSGNRALDGWLLSRALRNQETGDSRTFVARAADGIVGFYALSTAAAARVGLPGALRRNAPDPVPLLLLGQLAVHRDHQGLGIGAALLRDACLRACAALGHVGFRALATNPIDAAAAGFYGRFGFKSIPDSQPPLMILPVKHLVGAAAKAAKG